MDDRQGSEEEIKMTTKVKEKKGYRLQDAGYRCGLRHLYYSQSPREWSGI